MKRFDHPSQRVSPDRFQLMLREPTHILAKHRYSEDNNVVFVYSGPYLLIIPLSNNSMYQASYKLYTASTLRRGWGIVELFHR